MSWSVQTKDDALILKIGTEICAINVRDGLTDDASLLLKAVQQSIDKCLKLRRTSLSREMAGYKKATEKEIKELNKMLNTALKGIKD